uniref:Reverse transcriptase domain-containing protein n=1 Tax=Trichuris muris TaxID=70415 RepID=A0A5S6Q3A6_TRIMR
MEEMGIVRRSNSPWSSPLHMVPKASGGWRPCGDYRRLNKATTSDWYPVPHVQDFSANLDGVKLFSKIDLVRGYHQIPVHSDDIAKTAVTTLFGLFEFLRMPFGLKNAAQAFQRLMDTVCRGLDFAFVYLDDILIASRGHREHLDHLHMLFQRLHDHGLIINPAN